MVQAKKRDERVGWSFDYSEAISVRQLNRKVGRVASQIVAIGNVVQW